MEVVLIGTGGAAGWPEPDCGCASCAPARAARRIRAPAAIRLDGCLLAHLAGQPGDRLTVGGHVVRLHAGARPGRSAYAVTGGDGAQLLYAPAGVGAEGSADRIAPDPAAEGAFDVVVLGPGPDGIRSIGRALAWLRASAAVTRETDVVVVGLSHDDPPPAELDRLLAAWGARTVPDGTALHVRPRPAAAAPGARRMIDGPGSPRPRLRGRTLVLGGARSGKSAYAEQLLSAEPGVIYLATGGTRADDAEWVARVAGHRRRRPAGWTTVESTDVAAVLAAATNPVLLDCLGTWLAARVDHHGAWGDPSARDAVAAETNELVATWRTLRVPVVAVSNEVGSGVVPATASGRLFRDLLGDLNTAIAAESETVLLSVAGLTVALRTPELSRGSGDGTSQ